jgi:hypothetical protein
MFFSHLTSSKRKGISFEHAICHLSSDITGLWPMSLEDVCRLCIQMTIQNNLTLFDSILTDGL